MGFKEQFMISKEMQPKYEEIYKKWGWTNFNRKMELEYLDKEYHIDFIARDRNKCLVTVQEKDHSFIFLKEYMTFTVNLRSYEIERSELFESLATHHVCGYKDEEGEVAAVMSCPMEKFRTWVFNRIGIDNIRSGTHPWIETNGKNNWFLRVPFTVLFHDNIQNHLYMNETGKKIFEEHLRFKELAGKV
jgi:hypothetical protein